MINMGAADIEERVLSRRKLGDAHPGSVNGEIHHAPLGPPRVDIPFVAGDVDGGEWRYENRHQSQEICNGVWLGRLVQAKDLAFLKENGIRLVISFAPPIMHKLLSRYDLSGIVITGLHDNEVDGPGDVIQFLRDMCLKIDMVLDGGLASVLIACETGNTGSALGAAAYLIHKHQLSVEKAVQHIQQKRLSVAFDASAMYVLKTFELTVTAARQMALEFRTTRAVKRARDDEE